MANRQALQHVKKGFFALLTAWLLVIFYGRLEVINWLVEMDSALLTMLLVIVPLVIVTETMFFLYRYVKNKLQNIMY
jgi:hypothetical protein